MFKLFNTTSGRKAAAVLTGVLGPQVQTDDASPTGLSLEYSQALARGGDTGGSGTEAPSCCDSPSTPGPTPDTSSQGEGSSHQEAQDQCIINPYDPRDIGNNLVSVAVLYHRLHEGNLNTIEDSWQRPTRVILTSADWQQLLNNYLVRGGGFFSAGRPDAVVMRGSMFEHDEARRGLSNIVEQGGVDWMKECRAPKRVVDNMIATAQRVISSLPASQRQKYASAIPLTGLSL